MKSSVKCPNCGSTTVRSRSAVYKSGTSNYSGRHSSSGFSFGFGKNFRPRLFFGGGSHRGSRQSVIAQEAAPLPLWLGIFIFILVYFLLGGSIILSLGAAIAWGWFAQTHNSKNYEKQWVCSKCGTFFDPDDAENYFAASRGSELIQKLLPLIESHIKAFESKNGVAPESDTLKLKKVIAEIDNFTNQNHSYQDEEINEAIHGVKSFTLAKGVLIVTEVKKLWPAVEKGESKALRKKNAKKIEVLFGQLEELGETDIIGNYDKLKIAISGIIKASDAAEFLDKADDKHFLGDKKGEIKFLLEAMHSLIKSKITNTEFEALNLKSESTGQIWTTKLIKQRLLDAGYKPPTKKE